MAAPAPNITEFLAQKNLAVVGVSAGRGFANTLYSTLKSQGRSVVPVGRNATDVAGDKVYPALSELPGTPDGVIACVPPEATLALVDECAAAGIKHLWMQQGAQSDAAVEAARRAGINVVSNKCVLMYADPKGGHAFHAWLWRLFKMY